MALAHELREQLVAYLDGRLPLAALREWLDLHVQAVVDAGNREVDILFGEAYALLAELDHGHRTETEVQASLRECMALRVSMGDSSARRP